LRCGEICLFIVKEPLADLTIKFLRFNAAYHTTFVPEDETGEWKHSYIDQIEWEESALKQADVIIFWIPRDLITMPAFTTNIEWGMWCDSGKVVLGAPKNAPKMKYLRYYATKFDVPQAFTLSETIDNALKLLSYL